MDKRVLRIMRKERGLTQEALADLVGCQTNTISRLESGELANSIYADRVLKALTQPQPEDPDAKRPLPELLAEAAAVREAMQEVAHAISRGDGDRTVLLALADRLAARHREILASLEFRFARRGGH